MTFQFREARRENVPLMIGVAGGTGSGKTYSALELARGLADGEPFHAVDTENGRMLHYADEFAFLHTALEPPFTPARYLEAIKAAIADSKLPRPVVVVDSFSHEHAGEGGLLDWHENELQRMAGDDFKKRDRVNSAAWIKPKMAHKAMVQRLLQLNVHLVVCMRAEEKIDIVKDPQTGKTKIVPKVSLIGADGWMPIAEKNLPYELTASFLLLASAPGVPKPIKLEKQHRSFVPLDRPLDASVGRALGAWAAGSAELSAAHAPSGLTLPALVQLVNQHGVEHGAMTAAIERLFPGRKKAGELTGSERADLWAEVSAGLAAGATVNG